MRGSVVHQHLRFLDGVGGGRSLLSADFVEHDKHGGIDGMIDVEKGSGDTLHARDAAFLKFRCSCGIRRVLHLGPIHRCEPFLGGVLRARGYGVLEVLQGFAEGVGHGYVDIVIRLVPINGKSTVPADIWVDGDGVIIPECIEEVCGVVSGE